MPAELYLFIPFWKLKVMKSVKTYKNKKMAGQVLTYNSKNLHWLNRKPRPRMDLKWIEKTISKSDQKNQKKQKINVKMPHVNKKTTSEKWNFNSNKKLGLEWAVNGLGKPSRKKIHTKKIEKTVKIRVNLPHVNRKPLPRNRIFVQRPFSQSTLKLERKKFTPQNHSLFCSISCFGVTKITTPIWLQKWKCVNRS